MAKASAKHRITDEEILAQIPAAIARAKRSLRTQPHAASARFQRTTRTVQLRLTNGVSIAFPVSMIPELAHASDAALARIEVGPAGIGIHWPTLDVDLSVAGVVRAVIGSRALLQAAGAAGGRVRSRAKTIAARENGKKGGRPRGS